MFVDVVNEVSLYAIPVIILVICTYGVVKKVKVYEVFTEGARERLITLVANLMINPHINFSTEKIN